MISVTTRFNEVAAKVNDSLPSLRMAELQAAGKGPADAMPASRALWQGRSLNCYNYATDNRRVADEYPGNMGARRKGRLEHNKLRIFELAASGPQGFFQFAEFIQQGLRSDGMIPLGFTPDFSRPGTLVAAFLAEGEERREVIHGVSTLHDMHFYALRRLDEEIDGIAPEQLVWAHKPGRAAAEFCRAGAEREGDVSSPAAFFTEARAEGYNYFAGFFIADKAAMKL